MKFSQIIAFLLCFAFGCSYNKKSIVGVYTYDKHFEVQYTIEINQDSSFNFYWQHGLNFGITTGTLSRGSGSYILNSSTPHKIINVNEKITDSDSTTITLLDTSNSPLGYFVVEINDSIKVLTTEDGNVQVDKRVKINTIKVEFLNIPDLIYKVQDVNSDFFVVVLNVNSKREIKFNNINVKIKNKKLILKHPNLSEKRLTLWKIGNGQK